MLVMETNVCYSGKTALKLTNEWTEEQTHQLAQV